MANIQSTLATHKTLVLKSAILSRFLVFTLIIIFRLLVSPYDTSAPLNPDCLSSSITKPGRESSHQTGRESSHQTLLWPSLGSAIENGIVWDSVYFVRIAQCGYEYEQSYAFLPLLPICMSILSRTVFAPLVPLIGERAALAVSGYLINNVAFVFAALFFYKLSTTILKDPDVSVLASILFCFNPASIFYSSIYTESLYAFLSFGGLYHLISGGSSLAVLFLALSGFARSNGIVNAGYFCYQTMHRAYDALFQKRQPSLALLVVISGALQCACIFAPFIAFQAYGYHNICVGHSHELRPWCKARVPLLYNYIQSHYWGVGFLRYFQLKQLPNFLIASPILSLAFCSIYHYAKSRPLYFFSLGFQTSVEQKNCGAVLLSDDFSRSNVASTLETSFVKVEENLKLKRRKKVSKRDNVTDVFIELEPAARPGYLSASILPFVFHLGFMASTAFLVMHVQVATRFLSANPPLYWFAAYMMTSHAKCLTWLRIIWAYSAAYIFLGSLLFSNFYPFT